MSITARVILIISGIINGITHIEREDTSPAPVSAPCIYVGKPYGTECVAGNKSENHADSGRDCFTAEFTDYKSGYKGCKDKPY